MIYHFPKSPRGTWEKFNRNVIKPFCKIGKKRIDNRYKQKLKEEQQKKEKRKI
jgi:hypothetical protein